MNKEQILSLVKKSIDEQILTEQDILNVTRGAIPESETEKGNGIVHALYYIGGLIVIVGIIVLIAQNWRDIGTGGRLLVTLGSSFIALIVGAYFSRQKEYNALSQIFFTISAVLAPVGAYVACDSLSVTFFDRATQAQVSVLILAVFASAQYFFRKNILIFFVAIFATWFYYAGILTMLDISLVGHADILRYVTMVAGIAYISTAYGLVTSTGDQEKRSLSNLFYSFGTIAIMGTAITFDGVWDVLFVGLVFAGALGSVYIKSRAVLIISALFLAGYIIKITSKYFADSIGWPLALVVIGFLIIGLGYVTFYLSKKYISTQA